MYVYIYKIYSMRDEQIKSKRGFKVAGQVCILSLTFKNLSHFLVLISFNVENPKLQDHEDAKRTRIFIVFKLQVFHRKLKFIQIFREE